jgi:hypothetical protein
MMIVVLMLMPVCIMLGAIMLSNLVSEKTFLRYERGRGQSFYLAEIGINAAYYSFSSSSFTGFTHERPQSDSDPDHAGTALVSGALAVNPLIASRIPFVRISGGQWDGWYEYSWKPGSPQESLTRSGQQEVIRFRVTRTYDGAAVAGNRPTAWEIVSYAKLGQVEKTHRLSGDLQGLADYTIFDAGDLNEFIRGANQNISGKVHANGDIYLKPSGATLSINTNTPEHVAAFTTAGNFWYGRDATGRTNMGTVRLDHQGPVTSMDQWPSGLDSFSPTWTSQAMALWGGTVADHALGATVKGVPPTKSFDPDGYYADSARSGGLCIRSEGGQLQVGDSPLGSGALSTAVTAKSFYNHAEKRQVNAVVIDVSKLRPSDYPNGLIYSERSLVLINAQKLPQKTTIVSQAGVYTMGDYNKELATRADWKLHNDKTVAGYNPEYTSKVSSCIMTKNRVWHLSKNALLPPSSGSGFKLAGDDPEEYAEDNEWVNRENGNGNNNAIEINSMIVDGAPLYDEVWNRQVVDGLVVPKWGPRHPDPAAQAASWDDYLESFGSSRVVKKRGSIVHLQNGKLPDAANFNQSSGAGTDDSQVAWYRQIAYDAPFRDYGYDAMLKTDPPPFAPFAASRALWKQR